MQNYVTFGAVFFFSQKLPYVNVLEQPPTPLPLLNKITDRCDTLTNCYLNDISSTHSVMKRSVFFLISILYLSYLKIRQEPTNQYLLDKFSAELQRINQVCSSDGALRNLTLDLEAFSFGLYFFILDESVRSENIFRAKEQTCAMQNC